MNEALKKKSMQETQKQRDEFSKKSNALHIIELNKASCLTFGGYGYWLECRGSHKRTAQE